MILKGDELPIKVSTTGGSGLARVRGHVKLLDIVHGRILSLLKAHVSNES